MNRYEKLIKEHQGEIQGICEELLDEFGKIMNKLSVFTFSITRLGIKFK